jgi:IS30 family transposase
MKRPHLSHTERYLIAFLNAMNYRQKQIALTLNRSPSCISRELKRNALAQGYDAVTAQVQASIRARNSRNAKRIDANTMEQVKARLRIEHSPEQISAHLPISHTRIYQLIRNDKRNGGTLYRHCRCQKQRRKRYGSSLNGRGQIPNRRGIEQRPAHIETRQEFGHWEGDTMIGANHQSALVTLVERKTGFTLIAKVLRKTAQAVSQACIELLKPYQPWVKTITFDNGKEFAQHQNIDAALGSTTYFAQPYSSWQRGTNENTNGLIRQYIPKKRLLSSVSNSEIDTIAFKLNHRPRKRLNFNHPIQALTLNLFENCLS